MPTGSILNANREAFNAKRILHANRKDSKCQQILNTGRLLNANRVVSKCKQGGF